VQPGLVFAGVTDIGRRRTSNQDRFIAQVVETRAGPVVLLAVADGMGGAAGGEVASAHAVDELLRAVREADPAKDDAHTLMTAIAAANRAVFSHARRDPALYGMGTTLVAALIRGRWLVIGHVGDSRAYLLRGGSIRRLTADHSWVAEQVRRGELTEEEAATSSFRNILTRSVGVAEQVEPELSPPLAVEPGDIVLLCSDGLHGVVDDATIARIARAAEPEAAARRLVDLANERGGPDNITVVVARVSGAPAAGPTAPPPAAPAQAQGQEAADRATAPAPAVSASPARRRWTVVTTLALLALAGVAVLAGVTAARRAGGGRTVEVVASPSVASPAPTPPPTPPMMGTTAPSLGAIPVPTVPAVRDLPPCPDNGSPPARFCQVRPELPISPQEIAARFGISVDCLVRVNAAQVVARPGGELPLLSPDVAYVIPAPEVCAQLR
jgi:protein phosphatase